MLAAVYRGGGKQQAYLEFAQEHFLDWLRAEHLFEDEAVVFKGGTAIRKFVLGIAGRFSTDLDFAVADPTYADHILEGLERGVTHQGVTFVLDAYDKAARKGRGTPKPPSTARRCQQVSTSRHARCCCPLPIPSVYLSRESRHGSWASNSRHRLSPTSLRRSPRSCLGSDGSCSVATSTISPR